VDQVAVYVDERGLAGLFVNNVAVPNFLVQRSRGGHSGAGRILSLLKGK
jgi:hypothetical protein